MVKLLKDLLAEFPLEIINKTSPGQIEITGLAFDSRKVQPGFIFIPLTGVGQDGHAYIPAAIKNGAAAIIGSDPAIQPNLPYFLVNDTRLALAHISAAFYDNPSRKLTIIGVTGTDGKTTTCNLIFQILKTAGVKVGMISTVNAVIGDQEIDTGFHVTTPDAPDIQRYLADMVSAGMTHAVLEVTSHGLAQERVAAVDFDIGLVTNITHEHLDFHGDYEHYFAAKAKLFSSLSLTSGKKFGKTGFAVLNFDDQSFQKLKMIVKVASTSYSLNDPRAGILAKDIQPSQNGLSFTVHGNDFEVNITSPLVGDYNISNILAALGATVVGLGIDPEIAAKGVAQMPGVPGRMEQINLGQDFTAIVDFAHTPNALEVTLKEARLLTRGKVIAVFGSAGLRDREKRKLMAGISIKYADLTILTAEDPRTESLDDILSEMGKAAILAGGREKKTFWKIPDRGDAIRKGLELANPGDLVIACGKGHEQSMCFGVIEYPWDDRIAMRAALAEKLGIAGEKMPFLPIQFTEK